MTKSDNNNLLKSIKRF